MAHISIFRSGNVYIFVIANIQSFTSQIFGVEKTSIFSPLGLDVQINSDHKTQKNQAVLSESFKRLRHAIWMRKIWYRATFSKSPDFLKRTLDMCITESLIVQLQLVSLCMRSFPLRYGAFISDFILYMTGNQDLHILHESSCLIICTIKTMSTSRMILYLHWHSNYMKVIQTQLFYWRLAIYLINEFENSRYTPARLRNLSMKKLSWNAQLSRHGNQLTIPLKQVREKENLHPLLRVDQAGRPLPLCH